MTCDTRKQPRNCGRAGSSPCRCNIRQKLYSNEDNQSVPSVSAIQVESHNFLTPDYDHYYKEVTEEIIHVTDVWSVIPGGDKSENLLPQTSPFSGAAVASSLCSLELEPLQLEEAIECFCQNSQDAVDQPEILTSCALTETTQELLSAGPSGPSTERGSTLEGELDSGGLWEEYPTLLSPGLLPAHPPSEVRTLQTATGPWSPSVPQEQLQPQSPSSAPPQPQRQVT
ncbi:uncharacterized protein LOC135525829 isoform X2 [Oncorhynchus masou masou]|uniref:uncharacterized protein LOC135525829 isoform X2 n=1 Tax=Oncorhynchus masou masou TaxID=90313 RepID=UPI003183B350